jgi:hypothetical protein
VLTEIYFIATLLRKSSAEPTLVELLRRGSINLSERGDGLQSGFARAQLLT